MPAGGADRSVADSGLVIEGLTVQFDGHLALDQLDLAVPDGSALAVLGPSGSGKTTLLRAIAGLQGSSGGRILLDGVDLSRRPVHERGIGYVFQEYALFPHRSVHGNVEFGLRMAGWSGRDRSERAAEVLELVGLSDAGDRRVATLSGGEQQRVALARALAPRPRLLLLDEPFGALDRLRRDELMVEVAGLIARVGVTAIHVTHDRDEAATLGDAVAVLRDGRLAQYGTPDDIWESPASSFVARFVGRQVIAGRWLPGDVVATAIGTLELAPTSTMQANAGFPDAAVDVVVPPEAIELVPGSVGVVEGAQRLGGRFQTTVRVGSETVLVAGGRGFDRGERVGLRIDPVDCFVLDSN